MAGRPTEEVPLLDWSGERTLPRPFCSSKCAMTGQAWKTSPSPRRSMGGRTVMSESSAGEAREADVAMDRYAQAGDPKDFAKVVWLLQPRLLGYLRRQLHDQQSAEDLAQICFL